MAGSVNKVTLIGNLGRDPEIRATQDGREIANLAIATSESWKDKNTGERREKTEWHRVVIFNEGLVGVCKNYIRKGSKVYVEGQLATRKWMDKDGVEKSTTEVVLQGYSSTLTILDSKREDGASSASSGGGGGSYDDGYSSYGSVPSGSSQGGSASRGASPAPDLDDEIPF